jgi:hypothetical protein
MTELLPPTGGPFVREEWPPGVLDALDQQDDQSRCRWDLRRTTSAAQNGETPRSKRTTRLRRAGSSGERVLDYWARMDRSDEALLDFDPEVLVSWDPDRTRRLLAEQPDLYGNHLAIARFIDGWLERLLNDAQPDDFNRGFAEGLREIAAHLRNADFTAEGDSDGDDG